MNIKYLNPYQNIGSVQYTKRKLTLSIIVEFNIFNPSLIHVTPLGCLIIMGGGQRWR